MEYLFFILILLAGFHLFWENLVVPVWGLSIQEEITSLITRLEEEKEKIENKQVLTICNELKDTMVGTAVYFEEHNYIEYKLYYRALSKSERKKATDISIKRRSTLDSSKNKEILHIIEDYSIVIKDSFIANMSGWAIYILPSLLLRRIILPLLNIKWRPKKHITQFNKPGEIQTYIKFEKGVKNTQRTLDHHGLAV